MNLKAILTFFIRELNIFFAFSWRDWSSTIIPGSLFSIGALRSANEPLPTLLFRYLILVSWLTLFVYFFTLSNQITGVEEDSINKPDRPIPSGKVTLQGAKRRWAIVLSAYLAFGVFKPTLLPEIICWVITTAFLCLTPAGNHWFGKNCIAITVGTWALLSTSWKLITPATSQSERDIITVAVWAGILAPIQDLRDIEGDGAVGRRTMPLVWGESASGRIITFLLNPLAFHVLWLGEMASIAPIPLTIPQLVLGYRIMHARDSKYDHKTYMLFTYVFCLVLALISGRTWAPGVVGILYGFSLLSKFRLQESWINLS